MIRSYLSLASLAAALLLVTPGCGKKNEETQNPDGAAGDGGSVDGTDGQGGSQTSKPSKARGATATRSGGRKTVARKVTSKKPPRATGGGGGGDQGPNGMIAEAWQLESLTALPDFSTLGAATATASLTDVNIAERDFTDGFPGLNVKENYAVRLNGSLNITTEAEYELCLNSDDGSKLLLEDTPVVDNDGVKDAPTEGCGLVYLAPGEYKLEIQYFQGSGPSLALQFAWAADGGDKTLVPSEALFKPAT